MWFIFIYKQVSGHQITSSKDTGCTQQVNDFVATLLNKRYQDKNATELNMLPIKVWVHAALDSTVLYANENPQ
jgi:hypothetical protein